MLPGSWPGGASAVSRISQETLKYMGDIKMISWCVVNLPVNVVKYTVLPGRGPVCRVLPPIMMAARLKGVRVSGGPAGEPTGKPEGLGVQLKVARRPLRRPDESWKGS